MHRFQPTQAALTIWIGFAFLFAGCADAPPVEPGLATLGADAMDDDPETCGSCHQEQYEQWEGSMHAYSTRDPVFMAMMRKSTADTQGKIDQFCVNCHAPNASKEGLTPVVQGEDGVFFMDVDQNDFRFSRGVQCTTCHRIKSVEATQNAEFTLSPFALQGPTGSPEANQYHPMEKSTFIGDNNQVSFMCGSCHDVQNPKDARLEATFSEWYANSFNNPSDPSQHRSCVDCHMPTYEGKNSLGQDATLHRHTFVGVDQALVEDFPGKEEQAALVEALLQDCAELKIQRTENVGSDAAFRVSVKNINNGHNLPSGSTADRQVWVHLTITDSDGTLIYESGMLDANGDLMDRVEGHSLDPFGDPDLLAFGQFLLDDQNEHVNFPWEASRFDDNLIGPGQTGWREYLLPLSGIRGKNLTVKATLKYRTFPPFLLRKLVEEGWLDASSMLEVPIIEMETLEESFFIEAL